MRFVDFVAQDLTFSGQIKADPHTIAANFGDGDAAEEYHGILFCGHTGQQRLDLLASHRQDYALIAFAREDQHRTVSLQVSQTTECGVRGAAAVHQCTDDLDQ